MVQLIVVVSSHTKLFELESYFTTFVWIDSRFDGNPDLCRSASCKKEKKKFVVPVVASVASVFVVLAALIGLWSLKRKKQLPGRTKLLLNYMSITM